MKGLCKYITFLTTVILVVAGLASFTQQSGNAKAPIQFDSPSKIINYAENSGYGHDISFDQTPLNTVGMPAEVPSASAVESVPSPESAFGSDDEIKARLRKSLSESRKSILCSGPIYRPSNPDTKEISLFPLAGGTAIGAP